MQGQVREDLKLDASLGKGGFWPLGRGGTTEGDCGTCKLLHSKWRPATWRQGRMRARRDLRQGPANHFGEAARLIFTKASV
jgi:hypothetical protein